MSRNRFIRRKRVGMFQILLFLAFFITVGYAYLTQNLSITGTSFINNPRWDIYFDNIVVNPDSVELSGTDTPATIDQNNRTSVSFNVTLDKPGDFYEFTVDVVNNGTIDARISNVSFRVQEGESTCDCFESEATYEDGTAIEAGQELNAQNTITYKVKVGYKKDIDVSDLPSTEQIFNMVFSVTYVQSEPIKYLYQSIHDNSVADGTKGVSALNGHIYNSPEELMTAEEETVFLRHTVSGNQILKSEIIFYENNQYHTIYINSADDYSNMISYVGQMSIYNVGSLNEKVYKTNEHGIELSYVTNYYTYGIFGVYQNDTGYGCHCSYKMCECGYYDYDDINFKYERSEKTIYDGYGYNFQTSTESIAHSTHVDELDSPYSYVEIPDLRIFLRHRVKNNMIIGTDIGYYDGNNNVQYLRAVNETDFQNIVNYCKEVENTNHNVPSEYQYEELMVKDDQHYACQFNNGTIISVSSPSSVDYDNYRVILITGNSYTSCSCTDQQECLCQSN